MSHSIKAESLTKIFDGKKPFTAVERLSFDIRAGEAVAFLGPNGAGKSTTIKMLCGILSPSSGEAWIAGERAGSRAANQRLGLVFGTRSQLFMHMTVAQGLDLLAEIYSLTGAEKRRRIDELAALFEIERHLGQRVRSLSLGERMRCEIVGALLHRPAILLADEPTIGLDVIAKNRLRELVRRWQQEEKTTLMLTSHDLSDVEALCGRAILIDHGAKRFDGDLRALKGDLEDARRITITVADATRARYAADPRILPEAAAADADAFTHRYEIRTGKVAMSEALARLSAHYGEALQDIRILEVSLEEVLASLYSEKRATRTATPELQT